MAIPLDPLGPQPQHDQAALFQYQALESQNTFRLLRLHAGQGDRIWTSLHHYIIGSETRPSYRAISYTWGQDVARYTIHLPGNSVIKVRENLSNALRSIRDRECDCWLWIDAICINQDSNEERNHQIKLMADIYGMANVVLAWLQSADESADVARAFEFVHAAVTYDRSEDSVYLYSRAHPRDNKRNWRSVKGLCGLRYWTRKWIVQELVIARTVVLQVGNSECSMADFEKFCRQLDHNRDKRAYDRSSSARHRIWKLRNLVLASPAARLALQRLETRDERQPRLLHELIERYAGSACKMPCDHVYALYNLVGEHRVLLSVDYAATPVQRFVAVLGFIHDYEQLQPSRVLEFANLLARLLDVKQEDVLRQRGRSEDLDVTVPPVILGTVELAPETEASIAVRRTVEPLHPIPQFRLDTSHATWVLTADEDAHGPRVGRPDMTYFKIAQSGFHGLAACRLDFGDIIWHFPGTQLVFALRELPAHRALILGRAYLFSATKDPESFEFWLTRPFDYNNVRQGERHVTMNWAILLELRSLAIPAKDVNIVLKTNARKGWLVDHAEAL
ncbi:hypothetical protein LTR36_003321 [Oleoguttula mirabilis]|uniref:Heterokaryon incompatibility domain-containing protein n=1 Tax=Oleoguttula mirabilis TaxID=1507867 RepID=A0AAV9JYF3_9PEZI|nr:hypothetical protein LTR36_003321 [Oleoguttula mirabilis]